MLKKTLFFAGPLLIIIGAKLCLILKYGSDIPYWDQWDSEAMLLLKPWKEGTLELLSLFGSHNEHRIFFTKIWALFLTAINHQWDAQLETCANILIHLLTVLFFLRLGLKYLQKLHLALFAILVVLLYSLPHNWENTLHGFQSQFYFLSIFSIIHIWGSFRQEPFHKIWYMAQFAGLCSIFSMASGFFSALAILLMISLQSIYRRKLNHRDIPTLFLSVALVGLGVILRVPAPHHDSLKADSIFVFLQSALKILAWPESFPLIALIFIIPLVFFFRNIFREKPKKEDTITVALLLWIGLQIGALAYSRGGNHLGIASRYTDLYSIYLILSGLCTLILCNRHFKNSLVKSTLILVWALPLSLGIYSKYSSFIKRTGPALTTQHTAQEENIKNFLNSGNIEALSDKPKNHIPYPHVDRLKSILEEETILSLLPASIRRPIHIEQDNLTSNGFIQNDHPVYPGVINPTPLSIWSSLKTPKTQFPVSFISKPIPQSSLPILQFKVAGNFQFEQPESFSLVEIQDQRKTLPTLHKSPWHSWKNVNVFTPKSTYVISAHSPSPSEWIAFTEPVEVGLYSWLSKKLLHIWPIIFTSGLAIFLIWLVLETRIFSKKGTQKPSFDVHDSSITE
jgi:hypothetical protein